jgi:ABC-type dipeptide/oligopeptide/nickel transport system permease component
MSGYVARRLGQALLVLFIASAGAFAVLRLVRVTPLLSKPAWRPVPKRWRQSGRSWG